MPAATPRTVMSRSVTMPASALPSSTGNAPTSISRMRSAAACRVSSRRTVAMLRVMISAIRVIGSMREQGDQDDDRDRYADQPQQNGTHVGILRVNDENDQVALAG